MELFLRHEAFKDARQYYNQFGDQTMTEVEAGSGVSHSFIGRAESEKKDSAPLDSNNVAALAKYYGVTTDFLLGLDKSPYRDHYLAADCNKSGLSLKALENIRKTKDELKPEAFSILEFILSSPDLSTFLSGIAYSIYKLKEAVAFSDEVSSSPDADYVLDGNVVPHKDLLVLTQRNMENERFRLEYGWIEFLKPFYDIDAARSIIHNHIVSESDVS